MTLSQSPGCWVVVVAPRKGLVSEIAANLRKGSRHIGVPVECVTSQSDALDLPNGKVIRVISTTALLDLLAKRDPTIPLAGPSLVVCENLELLDSTYELGISLLRHATQSSPTRFVGFSSSLNDCSDLANWLDVEQSALHSFRPRDRDQFLTFSTQTFTIPQSAALFKTMAKSAHASIRIAPSTESAVVFVPSRAQCRGIARDLLTQCALESESEKGYLPNDAPSDRLEDSFARLLDGTLIDFVSKGVGFFHEGIHKADRQLMLSLYADGILRVLIVPRESCWTLPVRASVVVVMGAQYLHVGENGTDRQLRDYALTDLVRMQSRAVRHIGSGHFNLFCQAETKDTFLRFLQDGLPLESQLLESNELEKWLDIQKDRMGSLNEQQILDILSFTFLSRRIVSNPAYYDCQPGAKAENISRIVDKLMGNGRMLESSSTR